MGGKWVLFWPTLLGCGSGGNPQISPKPIKKLSLGAESYVTITWKGFFTQSQVLLASIVWNWFRAIKWNFCHLSLQRDGKTFALELSKCSLLFLVKCFLNTPGDLSVTLKSYEIRCQECSALTFSQRQKELKMIIWTTSFYCVSFLLSENVHLEDSNGISLRQARIWPFLNLFLFSNIVCTLTFYGK